MHDVVGRFCEQCNRDAIGAVVEVTVGNQTIRRRVAPTRSYLSQVELPVTIGRGSARTVDTFRVFWPDGTVQDVGDAPVDRVMFVEQMKR